MKNITAMVMCLVVFGNISYNSFIEPALQPVIYTAEAHEIEEVILIGTTTTPIDWSDKERVKEEIRKVFPEQPELFIKIAQCESQLNPNAHNPTNNSHDGGIFQISEKYHGKRMAELGLDPYNVQDNLKFARLLYDESGFAPWVWSKHCWNK